MGKWGLKVSALSFGTWTTFGQQVNCAEATQLVAQAFEAGVNLFDTAEAYDNGYAEQILGSALLSLSVSRDNYIISTKVFWGGPAPTQTGLNRKHIIEACEASLRRLRTDHLDIFLCHRPDPETPLEETVRAMSDLVAMGKVIYWGTSEWPAQMIREADRLATQTNSARPVVEQAQYNLFTRKRVEDEYLSLFEDLGIGLFAWSPLAGGVLSGKYRSGIPHRSRASFQHNRWFKDRIESEEGRRRVQLAADMSNMLAGSGIAPATAAIAWCLSRPNISSVVLGCSTSHQLTENLRALDVFSRENETLPINIVDALNFIAQPLQGSA